MTDISVCMNQSKQYLLQFCNKTMTKIPVPPLTPFPLIHPPLSPKQNTDEFDAGSFLFLYFCNVYIKTN